MTAVVGATIMEGEAERLPEKGLPPPQRMPPPNHWAQGLGKRRVIDSGAKTTSRQGPGAQGSLAEQ